MKTIKARTPGVAWKKAIEVVNFKGGHVKDDGETLTEILHTTIVISQPNKTDIIMDQLGDPKMIDWMTANFLDDKPVDNWGYSYGKRMKDFSGVNQIENIYKKLKNNPDSKSATINLMFPPEDKKHVPCVVAIDLKIRDSKLIGTVFLRSQDVVKKFYADIYSLGIIMEKMAKKLDVKVGELVMNIVSLHMYESDKKRAQEIMSFQ